MPLQPKYRTTGSRLPDAVIVVGLDVVAFSGEEARAFQRRWHLVEERQRADGASSTIEDKLDELERLMLSVADFGWDEALDDDAPVRARWARLREKRPPTGAAR
jgi:hypothetical protein